MSDKLRSGVSVTPVFVEGETPPPNKLNAISIQMKAASEALEKAVGDVHGQSFPYVAGSLTTLSPSWSKRTIGGTALASASERDLDIANLARLIGPASNLNPRMFGLHSVTENVPVGVYSFQLTFDPINTPVFSDSITTFLTNVTNLSNLKNTGEYHVSSSGEVFTVTATVGGTVTYNTNPLFKGGGMNPAHARFNVLPDPNQIAAGGAGLSWSAPDGAGRRTATLPTVTHTQSNYAGTSVTLDTQDPIYGEQLKLPKVLTDNLVAGTTIPAGMLYVKNETTNEVYEDAEYLADTESTVVMGGVDITNDIAAGHKFSIITVGTDITSSIDDLRRKSFHSHDRTFGEPPVHIKDVVGIYESNTYNPSDKSDNWMSQYMHRDGWDSTRNTDQNNTNDQNAMLGPFLLGKSAGTPGNRVAAVGTFTHESEPIYFSNEEVSIRRLTTDSLRLKNDVNAGKIELITTDAGKIELTADNDINFNSVGIIDAQTAFVVSSGFRGPEATSALVKVYTDTSYTLDSPPATGVWWSVGTGVNGAALPAAITTILGVSFAMKSSGETDWYPPNVVWTDTGRDYNYGLRILGTGGWALRIPASSNWIVAHQGLTIDCRFTVWYV